MCRALSLALVFLARKLLENYARACVRIFIGPFSEFMSFFSGVQGWSPKCAIPALTFGNARRDVLVSAQLV